jgi:hypothetical protein
MFESGQANSQLGEIADLIRERDNYADIAKQREIDCLEMRVEIERLRLERHDAVAEVEKLKRERARAAELLRYASGKDWANPDEWVWVGWADDAKQWLKDAGY